MPSAVQSDVGLTAQMEIREHVLEWISRDCGLLEFFIPDLLADAWTDEQKQAWINQIVDKFLRVSREDGKRARRHILACELAGGLRRSCLSLRQRTVTYRDIMKISVSLESLWNDISPDLDDATWAKCSRFFDVALSSLRVSYVWMYLKSEGNVHDTAMETRKALFDTLVKNFFIAEAPTDEKEDKHSTNFRALLSAWYEDLQTIYESDDFDAKLKRLEETNSLNGNAADIERFLVAVDVDDSWVLRMRALEREVEKGNLVPKDSEEAAQGTSEAVKRAAHQRKLAREGLSGVIFKPEPPESVSSFEPAQSDSDFDIRNARDRENEDDEDADSSVGKEEDQEVEHDYEVHPRTRLPRVTQVPMVKDVQRRSSLPNYGDVMRATTPEAESDGTVEQEDQHRRSSGRKTELAPAPQGRRKAQKSTPRRSTPRRAANAQGRVDNNLAPAPRTRRRPASEAMRTDRNEEHKTQFRRISPRLSESTQGTEKQHVSGQGRWQSSGVVSPETLEVRQNKRRRLREAIEADESQTPSQSRFVTETPRRTQTRKGRNA